MRKLSKLVASLAFLLPSMVLAFDVNGLMESMSFEPAKNDLSIRYLVRLFGNIGGIEQFVGSVSTITGTIFGVFNYGLVALAGIFLSYTFIKILTETASDGSAMGKTTTVWLSIRCALSTSLLVPQSSGYSIINTIVMWVVIQGVGLADLLWNKTLDYVTQKGSVLSNVVSSNNNYSTNYYLVSKGAGSLDQQSKWKDSSGDSNVSSVAVLKSLVCAYSVYDALEHHRQTLYNNYLYDSSVTNEAEKKLSENQQKVVEGNLDLFSTALGTNNKERGFALYDYDKEEGKVVFPYIDKSKKVSLLINDTSVDVGCCNTYVTFKEGDSKNDDVRSSALLSMVENLSPVARRLVDEAQKKGDAYSEYVSSFSKNSTNLNDYEDMSSYPTGSFELVNAALSYQNNTDNVWFSSDNSKQSDPIELMRDKGWLYAGAYYQYLYSVVKEEIQNEHNIYSTHTNSFANASTINKLASDYDSRVDNIYNLVDKAGKYGVAYALLNTVNYETEKGKVVELLTKALGSGTLDVTGFIVGAGVVMAVPLAGPPIVVAFFRDIPLMVLHEQVYNLITNDWKDVVNNVDNYATAIEKLVKIGKAMAKAGVNVYDKILELSIAISSGGFTSEGIAIGVTAGLAAGTYWGTLTGAVDVAKSLAGLNIEAIRFATTIIFLMLPVVLGIVGPLLACGLLLMVYVPAIPLILFLFGGLGWLIGVIILMLAAPIICFLMLWGVGSQDNPLLSREAEQFMMQLVGVFFRPALMVIGLIIGMILAEIGCNMLNEVFARMVEVVIGNSVASVDWYTATTGFGWDKIVVLFKVIGILTVYTFTLMSIINLAFSGIYLLYNEVMGVMGVSSSSIGNEQKAAEEIRNKTQQSSESLKQGSERVADSTKNLNLSLDSIQKGFLGRRNKRKLQERRQKYDGKFRGLLRDEKKADDESNSDDKNNFDKDPKK